MSSTTTTVDWSSLPPELLQTIASKSQTLSDYIRFTAVCRSFRSSSPITPRHVPREFPWLMLPSHPNNSSPSSSRHVFLNPLTKSLTRLTLPEASPTRRRAGSSHGWLVLIDESPAIFLINPLTRRKIILPPLTTFPNVVKFDFYTLGREYTLRSPDNEFYYFNLKDMRDSFIKKVIVSGSPYSVSCFAAFAILNHYGDVAYCRNGDKSWRIVEKARWYSEDLIYYDGKCYCVDKFGSIAICDVDGGGEGESVEFVNVGRDMGGDMQYLVDGMGELLLVSRYLEFEIDIEQYLEVCKTVKFCVFRLDMGAREWVKTSLGDKVLFLGESSSFALLASDYAGCKGNRIYFTDDYSGANYDSITGDHDVGVYSLEDGSIEVLPCYPRNSHWPIWITPNIC